MLADKVHELNNVTACRFCNSATSRDKNTQSMPELLGEAAGNPNLPQRGPVTRWLHKRWQGSGQRFLWNLRRILRPPSPRW